ncbi:Eco57I restriction-modification methylase domain-containing protein [Enterococcus cecorum]|nr:Eco57I restriction-modification methylase domain-containing protein [Enterococcus cecorum]
MLENKFKFDVIIGNPPYQEEAKGTSDKQIYHYFMDEAYKISPKVCFITPGKFLFDAGKTPSKWNKKMLNDEHLKVVMYEQNSAKIFPTTDIKGGVAITYRDTGKNFGKIGTFTLHRELNSILKKVMNSEDFESIEPIIYLQNKFNLKELYKDYPHLKSKIGSQGKEKRLTTSIFNTVPEIFSEQRDDEHNAKILGLVDKVRVTKYLNSKYLDTHSNFNKYKVLIPKANGSGAIGEVLSTPLVGSPLVGFTQSFISFGSYESEVEAKNNMKYLKTRFARLLLGVLKITQDNPPAKWKYVPLFDFTSNSKIDWSKSIDEIDYQLFKLFSFDDDEIKFALDRVSAMDEEE